MHILQAILLYYRYMHQIKPNPDVIVWTGDSSPHWKEGPDFDYIFSNFRNISGLLQRYFDGVPIIPALGNHDSYPPDDYPDPTKDKSGNYTDFYSKYLTEGGLDSLIKDPAAQDQFKNCGFYSVKPINDSNARFIVLNTNLYYSNHILPEGDNEDPCDQVDWLKTQLQEADEDDEIFVMAHVPPGFHERNISRPMFNVDGGDDIAGRFAEIFRDPRLAKNVVAQFYGHTHTDSFRIFFDDSPTQKRAISTAFIQASVTPSLYKYHTPFGVNPSVRMYHYENGTILDYEQHYLDLQDFLDNNSVPGGDRRARNSKFKEMAEEEENERRSKRDGTDDDHPEGKMEKADEETQQDQPKPQEEQQDQEKEQPDQDAPQDQHEQDLKQLRSRQDDAEEAKEEDTPSDPMDDLLRKLTASWKFYYNATTAFHEQDLSLKSMAKVYVDISHDSEGGVLFKQFYKHNTVKHFPTAKDAECDHMCWCNMTCSIVSFTVSEMDNCLQELCHYGYVPVGIKQNSGGSNETAEVVTTSENPEEATENLPKDDDTNDDDASDNGDDENKEDKEEEETATETDGEANHDADPIGDDKTDGGEDHNDTAAPVVTSVPTDHSLRGAAIGFCIVVVLAIAVAGLLVFRRVQRNRYRAQEFLLTDSVFRYDGYSQVDGP